MSGVVDIRSPLSGAMRERFFSQQGFSPPVLTGGPQHFGGKTRVFTKTLPVVAKIFPPGAKGGGYLCFQPSARVLKAGPPKESQRWRNKIVLAPALVDE